MIEAKFPVGTIVRLISGGPNMTVEELIQGQYQTQKAYSGIVKCVWFPIPDLTKEWRGNFKQDTLLKVQI